MNLNKEKILNAASMLFLEGGARALNVRTIAKVAGVSTIGIYSHFKSKRGILDALYIEGFERVGQTICVVEGDLTHIELVLQMGQNYLDLIDSSRPYYKLVLGESNANYQPSQKAKLARIIALEKLLSGIAAMLPGSVAKETKKIAALQILSLLHGAVSLRSLPVASHVGMADWQEQTLGALVILVDGIVESVS
jgi:AcrR family transcriptional regulator